MNWPYGLHKIPGHAAQAKPAGLQRQARTVIKSVSILILSGLLAACATGYQSAGLTGGYNQIPGPGKLDKVFFSGNAYITANTVKDYALYRVAEVAQSKNKPHFVIYQTLVGAARNMPASEARVGVVDNKPVAYAFVLYLDGPREGAMETAAVLKRLDWVPNPPPAPATNGSTSGSTSGGTK